MKFFLLSIALIFFISSNINSKENMEINKDLIPDGKFYFGINPTGQEDSLKNIFEYLMLANQEKFYSDDKRYEIQYGCKPRDCGNKGMFWIDNKENISIGVIRHTFWEKLDFSKSKENQIFIFTMNSTKIDMLPKEFKSSYNKWLKVKKIKPTLIRFFNPKDKLVTEVNF